MKFDSGLEEERYRELSLLQRAGEIRDISKDVTFEIRILGRKVADYTIDFVFTSTRTGKLIGEECKAYFHERDRLRFKMFLAACQDGFEEIRLQRKSNRAFYPVKISETGRILFLDIDGRWMNWKFDSKPAARINPRFRRAFR